MFSSRLIFLANFASQKQVINSKIICMPHKIIKVTN